MFSVVSRFQNAQSFIGYLHEVYGKTEPSTQSVESLLETWEAWKSQGMKDRKRETGLTPSDRYIAYFKRVVEACGLTPDEQKHIFFALARIKNLNAYASSLPNEDKVIVLDEKLVVFTTTFIVAATNANYSSCTEKARALVDQLTLSTIEDFYAIDESPPNKQIYLRSFNKAIRNNYKLANIAGNFSKAVTAFIICHELAHHQLGHSKSKWHPATSTRSHDKIIPFDNPNHREELAADELGYKLFLNVIRKLNPERYEAINMLSIAPLVFFEIIRATELFAKRYNHDSSLNNSHPSPLERIQNLKSLYPEELNKNKNLIYSRVQEYTKAVASLV